MTTQIPEAKLREALAGLSPEEQDQLLGELEKSASFGLNKTTAIGPTPGYRQNIKVPIGFNSIELPFSPEQAAEALPAIGAGGAGLLATGSPVTATALGGMAGEASRQLFRRGVGAPAATGITQRALDLDPNSPEAAVASIGGEGAASLVGAKSSKILDAISGGLDRSSLRSILNILQTKTPVEQTNALRLARVARTEGLVPPLSGRASQVARAQKALSGAHADSEALLRQGTAMGQQVEAAPVINAAVNEIPARLPGGGMPKTGFPQRKAANNVANDVFDTIAATGGGTTKVPLAAAVAERRRLDDLLQSMYDAGRESAPAGTAAVQNAADSWRGAIRDSFPELGAANLRQSDLISITKMMKRALATAERTGGTGSTAQEAGAIGAGAVGRTSIPAMLGVRALVTAAPFASLSAAGKSLASKIAAGGARTAQLWVRAADLAGFNTDDTDEQIKAQERNRKAAAALRSQAQGTIP